MMRQTFKNTVQLINSAGQIKPSYFKTATPKVPKLPVTPVLLTLQEDKPDLGNNIVLTNEQFDKLLKKDHELEKVDRNVVSEKADSTGSIALNEQFRPYFIRAAKGAFLYTILMPKCREMAKTALIVCANAAKATITTEHFVNAQFTFQCFMDSLFKK